MEIESLYIWNVMYPCWLTHFLFLIEFLSVFSPFVSLFIFVSFKKGEHLRIPTNKCCPECASSSQGSCQYEGVIYGVSDYKNVCFSFTMQIIQGLKCLHQDAAAIDQFARSLLNHSLPFPKSSLFLLQHGTNLGSQRKWQSVCTDDSPHQLSFGWTDRLTATWANISIWCFYG